MGNYLWWCDKASSASCCLATWRISYYGEAIRLLQHGGACPQCALLPDYFQPFGATPPPLPPITHTPGECTVRQIVYIKVPSLFVVMGFGLFWTQRRHLVALTAANGSGMFHSDSRRRGGLKSNNNVSAKVAAAACELFSHVICVYLTGVEEPRNRRRRWTPFPLFCVFARMFARMFAHRAPFDQWAVAAGGKSLHAAARSRSTAKFGALPLLFTGTLVHFCRLSQVYGLFEGMLEKLELDDDGE